MLAITPDSASVVTTHAAVVRILLTVIDSSTGICRHNRQVVVTSARII